MSDDRGAGGTAGDDRGADGTAGDDRGAGEKSVDAPTRRATVTTTHADAGTAERVAASLRPDNTAEMATDTEGSRVVTTATRDSTGGLASTLDDYVVNATVATELTTDDDARRENARHETDSDTRHAAHSDTPTS